ncbi:winged helix-turn-helix transcriptional regulator [Rhodococcoides yunnanense]|uniref:winged helix-turn-helix transcriptional regulator n=1 Tax=Rhodococcoides yunnanense TaxID=278209 RepID=UPI0009351999|nr:helix-turn-helix domain-containing protein [Rhodococcus yunnanensis]
MGATYHQFCPVAKAMELFDERWTLLVVRELVLGSKRFNDLRRGLPRMSPSLLSKRLHQLSAAGVVERRTVGDEVHYTLTDAGLELRSVVEALGSWGARWIGTLGDSDLDPRLLMWDMHRRVDTSAVPVGRTVVKFRIRDVQQRAGDWWLVLDGHDVDICDVDPGFDVSLTVSATLRGLTEIWSGDMSWHEALRAEVLGISGPESLRRGFPGWFVLPRTSDVRRALPGRPSISSADS